jgi:hypothetical protein
MEDELKQRAAGPEPTSLTAERNRPIAGSAARPVVTLAAEGGSATKRRSGDRPAKRHGRIDPEVLARIGRGLKDCFPDTGQEVPERFRKILQLL